MWRSGQAGGAPAGKGAGVRILAEVGSSVAAGDPVLKVVASSAEALERSTVHDADDLLSLA
ncbi:MAG: hypothetical protein AAGB11_13150 [Pseudomonadota bacterium]